MDEFKQEKDKAIDNLLKIRELTAYYEVLRIIREKRENTSPYLQKLTLDELEKEVKQLIEKLK